MEILGPFTATASGKRYLIFAVDPATFWTEATALTQNTPAEISQFVSVLLYRFGRAEFSIVGQTVVFCKEIADALQTIFMQTDSANGATGLVVKHIRYGVEHRLVVDGVGPESGITTGKFGGNASVVVFLR